MPGDPLPKRRPGEATHRTGRTPEGLRPPSVPGAVPPRSCREAPTAEPIFWEFARGWVDRRSHEVDDRTVEHWEWALNSHLRDHLGRKKLSEISIAVVDGYKTAKLREETLSAGSINKTLKVLAQILDEAIEYRHIETNPARGRKRGLKASRPRRTWLELDEVRSLLDGAGKQHRALLATMILAGLRVGELTALRWRDVDLAGARLGVEDSKTDAGERTVDLSPLLLDS